MAKTPTEIASLARSHTESALNVLSAIMNARNAAPSARVAAAAALLDRGWGKPTQSHEGVEGGAPILIRTNVPRKDWADGSPGGDC